MEGFGGKVGAPPKVDEDGIIVPPEAQKAMQAKVVREIAAKAGNILPVVRGKDRGLPKVVPIFDEETLRAKNADALKKFRRN